MAVSGVDVSDRVRRMADWVAMGSALVMLSALWLPWHQSGARSRNAFDLVIVVDRLDVAGGPMILDDMWRWLLPLVPVFASVAWVALILRRRRLFAACVVGVALAVGLPALLLLVVYRVSEPGEIVAVLGMVVLAVGLAVSRLPRWKWIDRDAAARLTTSASRSVLLNESGGRRNGRS